MNNPPIYPFWFSEGQGIVNTCAPQKIGEKLIFFGYADADEGKKFG